MCSGSRPFDYVVALYLMTLSYTVGQLDSANFFSSKNLLKLRDVNVPNSGFVNVQELKPCAN